MIDNTPIESLARTSAATIKRLKNLRINTYGDLLSYYPARYEDFSKISTIATVRNEEIVTLRGTIATFTTNHTRRGFKIQKAKLVDPTGHIDLIWYNQPYLSTIFSPGTHVSVSGKIELFGKSLNMKPSEYEVLSTIDTETVHTGRLLPVYPQIYGLSTRTIREKIHFVLEQQKKSLDIEFLPTTFVQKNNLLSESVAVKNIHFPTSLKILESAQERLGFDELFIKLLSSRLVRKLWEQEQVTHPLIFDTKKTKQIQTFIKKLPFELTGGQKKAVDDILADLAKKTPMNRFLQGDVGSGKTVVSAIAAYASHICGFQTLIMAPTEILALQHYNTLTRLFEPLGLKVAIQTGAKKTFTKKDKNTKDYQVIVGTHALLTDYMEYDRVGLVVIDEQHRFGVRQRAILKQKSMNSHLLTMTATPIPRTVSLTLYSELDLSIIDEMPKGRLPIKTHVVTQDKRDKGYEWIRKQIDTLGIQVYIICPLVDESETMQTVKAATQEYEILKKTVFSKHSVALLHGKMKPKEKEEVMKEFKEKKYDILVSTSVVEVGIDVPNATIMIIEGAERFGLAQLHQLRGRVGRGDKQSYCFLYTSIKGAEYSKRLRFFAMTNSGMKLAEYDLMERGPGELYGTQQSGYSDLKIASLTDYPLVKKVKDSIDDFMNTYKVEDVPSLQSKIEKYQIEQISRD